MLLGGLWHGANWTFVAWGGLHGAALAVNHVWQGRGLRLPRAVAWALTLLFVMACWVLFRSADFTTAGDMLLSMVGRHGVGPDLARPRIRRGADRRRGGRAARSDQPGGGAGRSCSRRRGWPCPPVSRWPICCCWSAAGCRMSSSTSSSDATSLAPLLPPRRRDGGAGGRGDLCVRRAGGSVRHVAAVAAGRSRAGGDQRAVRVSRRWRARTGSTARSSAHRPAGCCARPC